MNILVPAKSPPKKPLQFWVVPVEMCESVRSAHTRAWGRLWEEVGLNPEKHRMDRKSQDRWNILLGGAYVVLWCRVLPKDPSALNCTEGSCFQENQNKWAPRQEGTSLTDFKWWFKAKFVLQKFISRWHMDSFIPESSLKTFVRPFLTCYLWWSDL